MTLRSDIPDLRPGAKFRLAAELNSVLTDGAKFFAAQKAAEDACRVFVRRRAPPGARKALRAAFPFWGKVARRYAESDEGRAVDVSRCGDRVDLHIPLKIRVDAFSSPMGSCHAESVTEGVAGLI